MSALSTEAFSNALHQQATTDSIQPVNFVSLIEEKRDGGELTPGDWSAFVRGYMSGAVADYQMSAMLMAINLRGMTDSETLALTRVMLDSGARLERWELPTPRVDKHSTGGVGDKVSLILAPLVSSLGICVPMMSGRGLGHTGGTLDKLESIPGFSTEMALADAERQLGKIGCVMIGQSEEIAPADRRMYALRDATGTVPSIPLIASSIMSKKLAEGLHGAVFDVKYGSGALLPNTENGFELARLMRLIASDHDLETSFVFTSMNAPLGRAIGNSLEVEEAILALQGGVEAPSDLMAVTIELAAEMLLVARRAASLSEARDILSAAISSGAGAEQFTRIIEMQGGNPAVVEDPALLPQAQECEVFYAPNKGTVLHVEPRSLGLALIEMGGGRKLIGDSIDPSVGFVVSASPGEWVDKGSALATVFASDAAGVEVGMEALSRAIHIGATAEYRSAGELILPERLRGDG